MKGLNTITALSKIKKLAFAALLILCGTFTASAQEYVSLTNPAKPGKAPGAKVKLLSTNGKTKTYLLVLATGDEVTSGIAEFAQKYQVKNAHYTAFGDATSAKFGWYDKDRKMFKLSNIAEPSEVTGLVGDISLYNGKPFAHSHGSVATSDGICHGGHLLELIVGPTFEFYITVEPTAVYKKISPEFNALIVDPDLEK
ncbi:DNA-binding protein [Mucilaginibacter sp. ZT4R22]|uniref:DNA-binding protein n=1 Tax=Mucilaginibacter pankratovii TaxID=2772110 RepID=A0ABR7WJX2_9SPHI|nr:PPC domain-containing DNA-binding protein [Mucilaginibacter pankratovii]MBD1362618.1 DNA-binding protein [Mucilaginibacter pankratovii]